VELEGGYANDRPILFMQLDELENILAAEDKIVVQFIPSDGIRIYVKARVLKRSHQDVNAAIFGPGNLLSGPRYKR
jgi:hypothetical protein